MIAKIKNIFFLGFGAIFGLGANFLIQFYLARELTVSDFGIYTSIINVLNLSAPLVAFGVCGYLLKIYSTYGMRGRYWIKSIIKIILISIIFLFIAIQTYFYLNDVVSIGVGVCYILYMLSVSLNPFTRLKYQVEGDYGKYSIWQILPNFIRLLFLIFVVFVFGISIENIGISYGLSSLFVLVFSLKSIKSMLKGDVNIKAVNSSSDLHIPKINIKEIIKNSYPYGLSGFFFLVYYQSDIFILTYYLDFKDVGNYGFAFMIVSAICIFPSLYYQSLCLPKLHKYAVSDLNKLKCFYNKNFKIIAIFGLFVSLLYYFLISRFIEYFFDKKYEGALGTIEILSIYILLKFISLNADAIMNTGNLINIKVKIMFFAAIFNVIFNLIFIPSMGIMAAAYSTILTELILIILFHLVLRNFFSKKGILI